MRATRRALLLAGPLLLAGCYAPEPAERPVPDFVVMFEAQATAPDAAAARVIAAAAAVARALPGQEVRVGGYADPSLVPQAAQIRSRLRAQAVAVALLDAGVARGRIVLRPRQAIGGDPGLESRRVTVGIGR